MISEQDKREPRGAPLDIARRGGPMARRLKALVRDYVKAERGRVSSLAQAIGRHPGWVSEYVDDQRQPPRWADLDTALLLCEAVGLDLADILKLED